jgi:hypothetical protein
MMSFDAEGGCQTLGPERRRQLHQQRARTRVAVHMQGVAEAGDALAAPQA